MELIERSTGTAIGASHVPYCRCLLALTLQVPFQNAAAGVVAVVAALSLAMQMEGRMASATYFGGGSDPSSASPSKCMSLNENSALVIPAKLGGSAMREPRDCRKYLPYLVTNQLI